MSSTAKQKAPDWRAVDPKKIASECSPRHVQSVIEDAQRDILAAEKLSDELSAFAAFLLSAARLLLVAKSPPMTYRYRKERKAYEMLADAISNVNGVTR